MGGARHIPGGRVGVTERRSGSWNRKGLVGDEAKNASAGQTRQGPLDHGLYRKNLP